MTLDIARIRKDFPILDREVRPGVPLVYLDNAATSQKPTQVLDAMRDYYERHNANVHRGIHTLAEEATALYEGARDKVAAFINAAGPSEVVFTKNSSEALNLLAHVLPFGPGDEVVVTEMEHHSNLVPWQLAAERRGLELAFIHTGDDGTLDVDEARELIAGGPTKLVSLTHQSNVLGTINPVREITRLAHEHGALVCVDAAQSVPHMPVSVADLDCDFLAFSGHKMCGPMGIGVLWARPELLDRMPPFLGGGSMILKVGLQRSSWNTVPHKFEAGTPDVASAAGLVAAMDYLDAVGLDRIHAHEQSLTQHMISMLDELGGITVYGPRDVDAHGGAVSFNVADVHPHDVGTIVDREGVAVRAGHHCCQPLMQRLDVAATARASVYLYTTHEEVDALGAALQEVKRVFRV